jgi:hypothetical protein
LELDSKMATFCRITQIKTKDDEGITEIAQPMLSSSIVKLDISTEKI